MDVKKIYQEVKKKFDSTEFSTRRKMINKDMSCYFGERYSIEGTEGEMKGKELPGMTFVTSNKPQVWANHCINVIASNNPVVKIVKRDSTLHDTDAEKIRNWWATVFYLANLDIEENAMLPVHEHMTWNAVMTDNVIVRSIIDTSEGQPRYDIRIADTIDTVWARKKKGLDWVAFRFTRSKEEVKDEWGIDNKGETPTEIHWWGRIDGKVTELVFVGDELVKTIDWSESMPGLPVKVCPILLNPTVEVNGQRQLPGASVFWGVRDQFDEENRAKSVKATLLMREACPALKHLSLDVNGNPGSLLEAYPKNGQVVEMQNTREELGTVFANTPTALQATQVYDEDASTQIEQGTAYEIAYGGQEFSRMPTSLWDRRAAQMGKVLIPRKRAMEIAYKGIFNSLFEQFITMNIDLQVESTIGEPQLIKSSDLAKLKDKFRVEFEVKAVEPTGDLIKFQKKMTADQAGVDEEWSNKNILEYEDITRVKDNRIRSMAMQLSPTLSLFDYYNVICKEYDNMKPGEAKAMKLQEINFLKSDIVNVVKMSVQGGMNEEAAQR